MLLRGLKWAGAALGIIVILLMLIGGWSHINRLSDKAPFEMVEVEPGRRLHTLCEGPKDAPLVFYDAGMFGIYADGWWIKEELKDDFRVCLYDRAGLGWSDPVPKDTRPSSDWHVEDIRRLAKAVHAEAPYYLVGHSAAGFRLHAFVNLYPDEVAGLVLIEAAAPTREIPAWARRLIGPISTIMRLGAFSARIGVAGGVATLSRDPLDLPAQQRRDKVRSYSSVKHQEATRREMLSFDLGAPYLVGKAAQTKLVSVIEASSEAGVNGTIAAAAKVNAGFGRVTLMPNDSHVSVLSKTNAEVVGQDIRAMEALRRVGQGKG